jgi:hypothetical protein
MVALQASSGSCAVREEESGEEVRVVQGIGVPFYRAGGEDGAARLAGLQWWRPSKLSGARVGRRFRERMRGGTWVCHCAFKHAQWREERRTQRQWQVAHSHGKVAS